MTRLKHILLASCTAAAVACAPRPDDTVVGPPLRDDPGFQATTADPTEEHPATPDAEFVQDMMRRSQTAVELGQLAATRAHAREVRELAETIVRHHRAAAVELQKVAAGVQLDPPMPDEHAPEIAARPADLEQLSGAAFDRAYVGRMVQHHEAVLPALEDRAERAEHEEIRQWAAGALPAWREHLERARQLEVVFEVRPLT